MHRAQGARKVTGFTGGRVDGRKGLLVETRADGRIRHGVGHAGADRRPGAPGRRPAARMARLRRRPRQLPLRRGDARSPRPTSASSRWPGPTPTARPISIRSSCAGSSTAAARTTRSWRSMPRPGKQIWIHEGVKGFNVRGVNYWESKDGKDRRLFFSVEQLAPGASTRGPGRRIPSFGVDGRVDLRVGLDRDPSTVDQQSRTPGRVFENLIIMGSATNQEYASAPGDIRAFDVRTGALVWTFHTVPRPGEFGYDTWPRTRGKRSAAPTTGASSRSTRSAASSTCPTASPKYNFYGGNRKGANLFGDCLLALDARTGKRLWHFQTVHHDIWDLDNNSAPQLTTIRQNGQHGRRRGDGQQDRLPLCVRSRHRQADLADRGASGAAGDDCARRGAVADAAVSDQPAAVLAPEVHRRRSEPAHPDAGGARAVQAAHPQGAETTGRSRRSGSTK